MRDLVLRPAAQADLERLLRFIADRSGNPETAIGYIQRIRAHCEKLRDFPQIGRPRDDLRPGLRIIAFERRVVIAYVLLPSGDIEIGRVFYGGRNYEALIRDDTDL
ncbi:MAG TPA: type II toxin-antitoxin system RelE/ParE family toxin [Stellaceae bacterium]|nr:type II toxin-antitoxin system RelE/ParE family toxin [Stellaceae bacterium]